MRARAAAREVGARKRGDCSEKTRLDAAPDAIVVVEPEIQQREQKQHEDESERQRADESERLGARSPPE